MNIINKLKHIIFVDSTSRRANYLLQYVKKLFNFFIFVSIMFKFTYLSVQLEPEPGAMRC